MTQNWSVTVKRELCAHCSVGLNNHCMICFFFFLSCCVALLDVGPFLYSVQLNVGRKAFANDRTAVLQAFRLLWKAGFLFLLLAWLWSRAGTHRVTHECDTIMMLMMIIVSNSDSVIHCTYDASWSLCSSKRKNITPQLFIYLLINLIYKLAAEFKRYIKSAYSLVPV